MILSELLEVLNKSTIVHLKIPNEYPRKYTAKTIPLAYDTYTVKSIVNKGEYLFITIIDN
jgi:hypothetical protein